jgi:SnoaL-like domain
MSEADVLTRLLHAVDRLDWAEVRRCLAAEIRVDYTELSGGEPETLAADDLVERWRALLPGFDVTQHMTGPVLVSYDGGPGVRADAHVRGYHRLGTETWAVHGHYVARLLDGKIAELTLQVFYQEGNLALPEAATKRAATRPRAPRSR